MPQEIKDWKLSPEEELTDYLKKLIKDGYSIIQVIPTHQNVFSYRGPSISGMKISTAIVIVQK